MRRRIGLEDEARRPPRFFPGEIAQADPATGTERRGVVQHGMHLGMARHAIDLPFVEIDQWARFAQLLLGRMEIVEERDRKRIDIQMGDAGTAAIGCGRTRCTHRYLPKFSLVMPCPKPLSLCPKFLVPSLYCSAGISQR